MKILKVFEAFSGYGSQSLALKRIGLPYQVIGISEIDKNACKAYYALHDNNITNYGDICLINPQDLPEFDLFTYSFPCTDISLAGQLKGIVKGETRSGLLYECEKIIAHCRPKYLLMENVKNLVGKKFKPQFDLWLSFLSSLGYHNQWFILNAKDFGIPQSRERVFCISTLDCNKDIQIVPSDCCLPLESFLDTEIAEKYYYTGQVKCPTINGNGAIRGRANINGIYEQKIDLRQNGLINTLTTVKKDNIIIKDGRIRYLTERECFRLMGLDNDEIIKITQAGISMTNQYKLAGNSIVIPVLEAIFKAWFTGE